MIGKHRLVPALSLSTYAQFIIIVVVVTIIIAIIIISSSYLVSHIHIKKIKYVD